MSDNHFDAIEEYLPLARKMADILSRHLTAEEFKTAFVIGAACYLRQVDDKADEPLEPQDAVSAHRAHVADIKARIARAGTTQAAIARYLGLHASHLSAVITGSARSRRVEAELEKIIGKPLYNDQPKPGRQKTVWNGFVQSEVSA